MVQGGVSLSTAIDMDIGVKQGCSASPHVFCLFLDRVWDFLSAHTPPSWHAHSSFLALLVTFILLYIDDLVFFCRLLRVVAVALACFCPGHRFQWYAHQLGQYIGLTLLIH